MAASRSQAGRIAALERWAHEPDPTAALAPARSGFRAKFERQVDPTGTMPADELAARVDRLVKAHMTRLSAKASAARRRKGRTP